MEKKTKKEKTNKKIVNFEDIKKKSPLDYILVTITIILTLIGLVMVLSASAPSALINYNNSYYFFNKEVLGAIGGLILMFFISTRDITKAKNKYWIFYGLALISAFIVIIPGLGTGAKGATRWLKLGPISFQPSEFTKLFLILAYSGYYTDPKIDLTKFKNYFVIPFVFLIPIAVLLVKVQNHASAAIIVTAVVIIITIMSQIKTSDLVKELGILIALISGGFIIFKDTIIKGFRGNRLAAWLHTWEGDNPIKISYQTVQSLYAISAGGLFGVGLGKSKQKYLYIPEAHNDFIFAIIAEELGLIGAIVVIALFVAFAIRGYLIVARVKDRFSKLVATGITSLIILQAFLNIGVVTNTIPNTGISLPFLSYGNTSLIILLGSVGILLGISRNAKVEEKTEEVQEGANQ